MEDSKGRCSLTCQGLNLTRATDGIGLETARRLVGLRHHVLLHGRNPEKLEEVRQSLSSMAGAGHVEVNLADLSQLRQVDAMADAFVG